MKLLASGDVITCQGQDLLLTYAYNGAAIKVEVFNKGGQWVELATYSESGGVELPGHVGRQYRLTFSAGSVDVSGSVVVN